MGRKTACVLVMTGILVCTAVKPAHADGGPPDALVLFIPLGIITGLVTVIANGVNLNSLGKRRRSGNGWAATGLIMGFLLTAGGTIFASGAPGLGVTIAAYGALTVGIAGLATRVPITKHAAVSLGPVIRRDAHGHAAPGLALSALTW